MSLLRHDINPYLSMSLLTFSKFKFWSSSNVKSMAPSKLGSSSGSCIVSRNGCMRASSTVILLLGFKSSILSRRSRHSGLPAGNNSIKGTLSLTGSDSMYLRAYSLDIYFLVWSSRVPRTLMIRLTCSM